MDNISVPVCSICGAKRLSNLGWFLINENRWEDRLRILEWHDELAQQSQIHCACSASHVQELVVHWMTTGSLHHPFAKISQQGEPRPTQSESAVANSGDASQERLVAELAVHRESLGRALNNNLLSLGAMLDELFDALNHETPNGAVEPELGEDATTSALRPV